MRSLNCCAEAAVAGADLAVAAWDTLRAGALSGELEDQGSARAH